MRCTDGWYNEFLRQCRFGCLSADMYASIHGLASFTPACIACACNSDVVLDPVLGIYKKQWMEPFAAGAPDMMAVIEATECSACREERRAKKRVLSSTEAPPLEIHSEPFSSALAVCSFNVPR